MDDIKERIKRGRRAPVFSPEELEIIRKYEKSKKEERPKEEGKRECRFPDEKEPPWGKVYQGLLRDPKIEVGPKILWGLVHSYAREKRINNIPTAFMSCKTMAEDLGVSALTIKRWIKRLKDTGWVGAKRRGQGQTNIISLYSKKRVKNA
jgi:hypothetical protein